MNIVQVVPKFGNVICGVGDYAKTLAVGLRKDYSIDSSFLSAQIVGSDIPFDFKEIKCGADAFAAEILGQRNVLLHYVGYGFQKRGCPFWLLSGLKQWKQAGPSNRLTTMFHELHSTGWPWRSSFWASPFQRWLCCEFAKLSDSIMTNRQEGANILMRMAPDRQVKQLPVFSNVGEPSHIACSVDRHPRLVIFGSAMWRIQALTSFVSDIRAFCVKWNLSEVIEIGPGSSPSPDLGVPLHKLGPLPSDAVSCWLSRSRFGFLCYPASLFEKSGIFAAYAAHGVVPLICNSPNGIGQSGLMEGLHFWSINADSSLCSTESSSSGAVFSWYQHHRSDMHVATIAGLLTGECAK
jgi:hypothetical protein